MKHLLTLFLAVCCLTAYGQSLSFDGNDDQVTLNQLVLGETFSFEMWVLFDGEEAIDSDAGKHIVSIGASNTEWASFAVGVAQCAQCAEAFITCEFDVNQQFAAGTSFPFGEWVHISVTFDSGLLKVYQQGELVLQEDLEFTEPRNDWGNAYFGSRGNFWQPGDYAWNGKIARISQWTTALDQFEILHLIGPSPDVSTPGIEGLWLFDQGGGDLVVDLVGDNDGSIQGATWDAQDNDAFPLHGLPEYVPTEGLYGWYNLDGNAIDNSGNGHHGTGTDLMECEGILQENSGGVWFNGTSAVVEWANAPELSLEVEDSLSFAMWVRSDFQHSPSHLLGKRGGCSGSNDINYQVAWQDDNISNDLLVGMTVTSCEESVPGYNPTSDWTHLAFTYASGHSRMYVNGEEFLLFDCPSYPGLPNDEPLLLGRSGSCDAFEGCMDEFGIWTTELTPEQVLAMYQSSAPIEGCTDEAACNFDAAANIDNGTCASCETLATACGVGTTWDAESGTCIVANPADTNLDGCVQLNDLLDVLSAYGDCGAEEFVEAEWTSCGDHVGYQGYNYETVLIGEDCWFVENVRYLPEVSAPSIGSEQDGLAHAYVYEWYGENGDVDAAMATTYYSDYGVLYNFQAVETWSLCPSGWHVPSSMEFRDLDVALGLPIGDFNDVGWSGAGAAIGTALKVEYGWCCGGGGTNTSGFSAKGAGGRWGDGQGPQFSDIGAASRWWTSTSSGENAWHHDVASQNAGVYWKDDAPKSRGHSVRCIKDTE